MRDPEASEPFTLNEGEELDRVLQASEEDPAEWLAGASKFLAYSGAHISVLSGGYRQELVRPEGAPAYIEWVYSPPIRGDAVRGDFIYWNRPKNEKPIGMPLSRHLRGWLPEYLDMPRPAHRTRYNQVLNRVGSSLHLQVNPLRFRHSCAVRLYHVMGLDAQTVERLLGVTAQTLATYVMKPKWMVQKELASKGW